MAHIYQGMVAILAAAIFVAGCGKKEMPADLAKTWDQKEAEIMNKLTEVRGTFDELSGRFQSIAADSSILAKVPTVDGALKAAEMQIGEVEKVLNDTRTQRDSLVTAGRIDELNALWGSVRTTYDAIQPKLNNISSILAPIDAQLKAATAGPDATGTPAATATPPAPAPTGDTTGK